VGLASAYLYRHSRSLLPCILLHAAYNAAILADGYALRM
jgi:membrane protease YdiL (CAAX protease family)